MGLPRWLWEAAANLLVIGVAAGVYQLHSAWVEHGAEVLCREFAALKNANDPRADELLGPAPPLPEGQVTPQEAAVLDAEFVLRRPFRVLEVRPVMSGGDASASGHPRFKLVVKGGLASEMLHVEGDSRPSQRVLHNPDILVEVREGKIHGVRAGIHED
jgi:hypothetical protein